MQTKTVARIMQDREEDDRGIVSIVQIDSPTLIQGAFFQRTPSRLALKNYLYLYCFCRMSSGSYLKCVETFLGISFN